MALSLLHSEEHNKYLTIVQWPAIVYWNLLKSSVHNCLSQLSLGSPIESVIWTITTWTISISYQMSDKWLVGLMGE